jgi:hypothetical protein
MPRRQEGRALTRSAADQTNTQTKHREHTQPPYLWASASYAPAPGRALWHYAVECPRGHVHLHRGGPPRAGGHSRVAPCGARCQILARAVDPVIPAQRNRTTTVTA